MDPPRSSFQPFPSIPSVSASVDILPPFSTGLPFETTELYVRGGFHPISIGDTFKNDRYRVINKLARGGNSTIWLVEDLVFKRLASLKVLSAHASSWSSELEISRHLQTKQKEYDTHPGKVHVVTIIDTFEHEGPNGLHHCIVTEVLGISLDEDIPAVYYGPGLGYHSSQVTTKVATQVALGLAYLHKCGIVHGNLNLGHVLFYSGKLQDVSADGQKRIYGEVKEAPIKQWWGGPPKCQSNPPKCVVTVPMRRGVLDACLVPQDAVHVKICDFGNSSLSGSPSSDKAFLFHLPLAYIPPEVIFDDIQSLTRSTDMWAYGVLLYMIMNDKNFPFPVVGVRNVDSMLEYIVMSLGKLPGKWSKRWTALEKYFSEDLLKRVPMLRFWITAKGMDIANEEIFDFERILVGIFRYEPEERISAERVVQLLPPGWKAGNYKKKKETLERPTALTTL